MSGLFRVQGCGLGQLWPGPSRRRPGLDHPHFHATAARADSV